MMKTIWKRVKPWIVPVVLTLLFYLLLQFVFLIGYVPSASMEPTLQEDSFIIGLRIHDTPKVGDVVIFEKDGKLQVKRIAAGPGDVVDYSSIEHMTSLPIPIRDASEITVPDGCFFLLGDNTQNSLDSRYWENPFVTENQIVAIVPGK